MFFLHFLLSLWIGAVSVSARSSGVPCEAIAFKFGDWRPQHKGVNGWPIDPSHMENPYYVEVLDNAGNAVEWLKHNHVYDISVRSKFGGGPAGFLLRALSFQRDDIGRFFGYESNSCVREETQCVHGRYMTHTQFPCIPYPTFKWQAPDEDSGSLVFFKMTAVQNYHSYWTNIEKEYTIMSDRGPEIPTNPPFTNPCGRDGHGRYCKREFEQSADKTLFCAQLGHFCEETCCHVN